MPCLCERLGHSSDTLHSLTPVNNLVLFPCPPALHERLHVFITGRLARRIHSPPLNQRQDPITERCKPEWRVRSCYLLTNVVGIAAERVNRAHHRRLGTVMRKLGWAGPKNLRFGAEQAKGYFKAAEDVPRSNHTAAG